MYGKLKFQKKQPDSIVRKLKNTDYWVIYELQPHVCIKLKKVFPKIDITATVPFYFSASDETCADLTWFMERYPMELSKEDAKKLKRGNRNFERMINDLESILLPGFQSTNDYELNEGFSARHYQAVGVDLFMTCRRLLIGDQLGLGKAQPLYSKIATPAGWIKMKDIKIGSDIFGQDGNIHQVNGIFPQGIRPIYRFTFNDGTTADCDENHIWSVRDANRRRRGTGWTNKTTIELLSEGITNKLSQIELSLGKNPTPKWEIPLVSPVNFTEKEFIIHPYILGLLIGDGSLTGKSICISIPDTKIETVKRVSELLPDNLHLYINRHPACPQYYITQKDKRGNINPFKAELGRLGLTVKSKEKFIPEEYLQGSVEQRKDLLKGLMDTDGSIQKKRVVFHTCAERLTTGITELVQSLGGMCNTRTYDRTHQNKGIEYQVNVRTKFCPFKINEKVDKWNTKTGPIASKYIKQIELIGEGEQQCISVTAPDNLYITDNYTVTHNTVCAILSFLRPGTLPAAVVVQAHLPTQWIEQIAKFTKIKVHFIKGTKLYDLPKADVYVFKYTNLFGWVDIFGTGFFKEVVFDEVQELRTGSVSAKYRAAEVLSLNTDYCMMLSATPIYNWANEIWNILNLMKRDCLGSFEDFTREWGTWDGKRFMCKDTKALGAYLREQFLFLQRTREDVGMELPEVNKIVHVIDYDQELMDKDAALAKTLAITVLHGSFVERGQAYYHLDALIRHATGVAKAKYVADYVKTLLLENKIPCILCAWHRSVYKIWEKEFEEYKPVFFTGHESAKQKNESVAAFINGDTNLFIMSLRSGAGIDGLQNRAHYIIYGELDWSPKVHEQSTGRLNRDRENGEKQQVTAVYLNSNGGSDPMMLEVLGMKSSQQHGIINPLAGPESQLSDPTAIKQLAASYLKNKGVSQEDIQNAGLNIPTSSCCGSIILTPGYCNTCELPCEEQKKEMLK